MSAVNRPWLECVNLHSDVLSDDFSEDIFALDLGSLSDYLIGKDLGLPDVNLPRVPPVYRDAESFFAVSYITNGLKSLLEDVLEGLSGAKGNRVLKLATPFGGGKSHTLATVLHAARSRSALNLLPEATELAQPEKVRIAVVDGQFFDAQVGKQIPNTDIAVKTLWGWIAWALGGQKSYELVREQDQARVAPGGDAIVEILRRGPSLILLDELLEYLISSGGVRVEQTTLRDETLSFLKRLTVAVGVVDNAVLIYSLQSSKRESLEYVNLLHIVEHLAARKDQRREPVEGDEILKVIQRRLLAEMPDPAVATGVAEAYRQIFTQMRRAYAHGEPERQQAEEEGLRLRDRIKASYPFHPALIDLMRERWAAIPDFQRTRGALRFLASCLRAAHNARNSRLLIEPGDVPMRDSNVRQAFFRELGQREDFQACLEHDFIGANARTQRIDDRRAREVTTEAKRQPATRLATAILMHSFGGLKRTETKQGDLLPPGIGESDLLDVSIGPDLDNTTIQACLKELREQCLYLHFDGVRYCFKKDPNVTLLIEQEAEALSRDGDRVRTYIREMIEIRLSGQRAAIIWPNKSTDVPDREAQFLIVYLPLEFATQSEEEKKKKAQEIYENYGIRAREFRNGLGLAVPSIDQIESLRRAIRYLLAVERIQDKGKEHNLTAAQKTQLKERKATETAAAESSLLKLYNEIWLPVSSNGSLTIDTISMGGRPLQTTLDDKKRALIHQRLIELLTVTQNRVFGTLAPNKILELFNLGNKNGQSGIATNEILAGFFSFLGFPRLLSSDVVCKAISRGVEDSHFGYTTSKPSLGNDGHYQINKNRIAFNRRIADDEIDLETGFLMIPEVLPDMSSQPAGSAIDESTAPDFESETRTGGLNRNLGNIEPIDSAIFPSTSDREIALSFTANKEALYDAWNALANLADLTGEISITIKAKGSFDKGRLENNVLEPLRELKLIDK